MFYDKSIAAVIEKEDAVHYPCPRCGEKAYHAKCCTVCGYSKEKTNDQRRKKSVREHDYEAPLNFD